MTRDMQLDILVEEIIGEGGDVILDANDFSEESLLKLARAASENGRKITLKNALAIQYDLLLELLQFAPGLITFDFTE